MHTRTHAQNPRRITLFKRGNSETDPTVKQIAYTDRTHRTPLRNPPAMATQSPWCTTSAALAAMLERERTSYRKSPPVCSVPLEEYAVDRRLMISWCRRLVAECGFDDEIVHTVSLL